MLKTAASLALALPALAEAGGYNASLTAGSTPLNQYAMLMTHDSATGYLSRRRLDEGAEEGEEDLAVTGVVNNWAQTQTTGFGGQLGCGARAFDLRPYQNDDGGLIMHHGDIKVDHSLTSAVQEIVDWANANTGELVLVYMSHFDGASGCEAAAKSAIAGLGIHVAGCGELSGMTVDGAMSAGALSGGGHVLAVDGCVSDNWDSSITCYINPFGEEEEEEEEENDEEENDEEKVCWANTLDGYILYSSEPCKTNTDCVDRCDCGAVCSAEKPVAAPDGDVQWGGFETCYGDDMTTRNALYAYLDGVAAQAPPGDGTLVMAQGHWQYDTYSVTAGTLSGSSIIEDEAASKVNSVLAAEKVAGYAHLNLLEVDNVCDGGAQLLEALRARG